MPKQSFPQSSLVFAIALLLGCALETGEGTPESLALEETSRHGTNADDDFDCDGAPGFTDFENVFVRDGASCVLDAVWIDGDVQVEAGGSLDLSDSVVDGNVQSEEGLAIRVAANSIDGDIQVKKTRPEGSVSVVDNEVDGNVQIEENETTVNVSGNVVDGDLQFFENIAESPHVIADNTVDGDLQCKDNEPDPLSGGGNVVDGDREDQCEVLENLCPCATDLPTGWMIDIGFGGSESSPCPDGSTAESSSVVAVDPALGAALRVTFDRDCNGVVTRTCRATEGPTRSLTEPEFNACRNLAAFP